MPHIYEYVKHGCLLATKSEEFVATYLAHPIKRPCLSCKIHEICTSTIKEPHETEDNERM
jgi:hypothetical protein